MKISHACVSLTVPFELSKETFFADPKARSKEMRDTQRELEKLRVKQVGRKRIEESQMRVLNFMAH